MPRMSTQSRSGTHSMSPLAEIQTNQCFLILFFQNFTHHLLFMNLTTLNQTYFPKSQCNYSFTRPNGQPSGITIILFQLSPMVYYLFYFVYKYSPSLPQNMISNNRLTPPSLYLITRILKKFIPRHVHSPTLTVIPFHRFSPLPPSLPAMSPIRVRRENLQAATRSSCREGREQPTSWGRCLSCLSSLLPHLQGAPCTGEQLSQALPVVQHQGLPVGAGLW